DNYSAVRIAEYLKRLDYKYPYHQAIGFLLEKAGHSEKELSLFEEMGTGNRFYLDYEIADRSFSQRWNLIYPSAFDV
ncbi:MAG TPA: hypothetical protein PLZ43_14400, partial [bacterium]|nr:hypothetical protein [bacterium]